MSINFNEPSSISPAISELIQRHYISLREVNVLSENQKLNLESRLIRQMIFKNIIDIADAINLTPSQRKNFESLPILQLIEADILNWQQAYQLTDDERETIYREPIHHFLMEKKLTLASLKLLTKQQVENLCNVELLELWKTGEISWETLLNIEGFFVYILGHKQLQKLKAVYDLRTTDYLELFNFYDHSVTPNAPYSLFKKGRITFSQAMVSLINWASVLLMPIIIELVKSKVLSFSEAKELTLSQIYNLELPVAQYFLKKNKIYFYMFFDLNIQQIMNLESEEILDLVQSGFLELKDALQINYLELQNLKSIPVQLLIKQNQLTIKEAKNLKISHRLFLEREENLKDIKNGSFDIKQITTDLMLTQLLQAVDSNFFVRKDLSGDVIYFFDNSCNK